MEDILIVKLAEGLRQIDSSLLDDKKLEKMLTYYDCLMRFNPTLKLVGATGEELIVKHFLDSLAPVPVIKQFISQEQVKAADLGSGNGLPGLLLSIAFNDWDFSLVDKMGRRISFLLGAVATCNLAPRVKVVEKDLSKLEEKYNALVFRAFRPFEDIAKDLVRITQKGSYVFAYKSSEENIAQETETLEKLVPGCFDVSVLSYEVPFLEAKRNLMVLKRL